MRAAVLAVVLMGCSESSTDAPVDASTEVTAEDVKTEATTEAATDSRSIFETEAPCQPVQTFSFTTPADVALACNADAAKTILDVPIPARGRALGRFTVKVRHTGSSSVIHFWNARVEVGAIELAHGLGDDVCPGSRATRANLGVGRIDDTHPRVKVMSYQGSSPCTNGALVIEAGSKLDVWVEDPTCEKRDIAVASYYATAGFTAYWEWPTMMAKVISTSIDTEPGDKLRVLGVIEGTPHTNPNTTCGAEAATLVMQTAIDGAILSTQKEIVPASGGMGHLVLSTDTEKEVAAGKHTIDLLAGANFTSRVTTGGCCGDGTIVAIRSR